MNISKAVMWLSWLIAVLALFAASIGLFYQDGGSPFSFTTLHGQTVQMYGQGLYGYETLRSGAGYKGQDVALLVLGIPLLVLSILLYRRGSIKGALLLTGALAYFLYTYGSMALGAAYNPLFLVYVALFSASLFALVLAITSIDLQALPAHFSAHLPYRGIAVFLFAIGLSLLVVWLGLSIVPALLQGQAPPEVTSYTTLITHAVDLGLIAPVAILAGVLLLRRAPLGYLLASTMLVFSWVLGAGILALSAAQVLAGLLTIGQILGFVVPFVLLTLVGIWLTVVLFRHVTDASPQQQANARAAHA
jgi:hypothetical protein